MSRQVRTQMPQTQKKDKRSKSKEKKFDKNTCLLVFVLIFSGILIFLLLTASDNKKLNSTLLQSTQLYRQTHHHLIILPKHDNHSTLPYYRKNNSTFSHCIHCSVYPLPESYHQNLQYTDIVLLPSYHFLQWKHLHF